MVLNKNKCMRNLIILILMFLASCKSTDHVMQSRNITVYSNGYEYNPTMGTASCVFYEESQTYLLTLGLGQIIGTWETKSDTLFLYPKYLYRNDGSKIEVIETKKQPLEDYEVKQEYLIRGEKIIDITDYDKKIISPERDSFLVKSPAKFYRIMTSFKHFEPLKR